MVVSAVAIIVLSAVVFGSLKILLWINSVIFLSLMQRTVPQTYWSWTPAEVVLAAVASVSFAAEMILRTGLPVLPIIFGASSLAWLAYMARRVWLISEPRRL